MCINEKGNNGKQLSRESDFYHIGMKGAFTMKRMNRERRKMNCARHESRRRQREEKKKKKNPGGRRESESKGVLALPEA